MRVQRFPSKSSQAKPPNLYVQDEGQRNCESKGSQAKVPKRNLPTFKSKTSAALSCSLLQYAGIRFAVNSASSPQRCCGRYCFPLQPLAFASSRNAGPSTNGERLDFGALAMSRWRYRAHVAKPCCDNVMGPKDSSLQKSSTSLSYEAKVIKLKLPSQSPGAKVPNLKS